MILIVLYCIILSVQCLRLSLGFSREANVAFHEEGTIDGARVESFIFIIHVWVKCVYSEA